MDDVVRGKRVEIKLHPPLIAVIDDWRRFQPDLPPRAEAVVRLIEIGLETSALRTSVKMMAKQAAGPGDIELTDCSGTKTGDIIPAAVWEAEIEAMAKRTARGKSVALAKRRKKAAAKREAKPEPKGKLTK